jgi:predicted dehydrogenase
MIRIGMLGADSSHTETYIGLMNPPGSPFFGKARVVKLWGEDALQAQSKATEGVKVAATPNDATKDVDLVMVCSRWGEDHYWLARVAIEAGIPTYVDKPFTNSFVEAKALLELATARRVSVFSCSPYRYAPEIQELRRLAPTLGEFRSAFCAGLSEYPALGPRACNVFFYGVHPAEMLHAVFGSGMDAVRVEQSRHAQIATIRFRTGIHVSLHLLRDCEEVYHLAVYGAKGWAQRAIDTSGAFYTKTVEAILSMVENGEPPIPLSHAVEIIALLEAIERAGAHSDWVNLETAAR